MTTLLVVGARENSLGDAVVKAGREMGYLVNTAGVAGEGYDLNLTEASMPRLRSIFRTVQPEHVICTVGVNLPEEVGQDPYRWYDTHFAVNVVGPMRLLQAFGDWCTEDLVLGPSETFRHFVAISSNSATIPRTQSAAYCASKAALSQALRVKAREARGGDHGYLVYGYEPGWLADTPMSHDIESLFGPETPMHRMRGLALASGVSTEALANQIIMGLIVPGAALNGALIRYDGGEV